MGDAWLKQVYSDKAARGPPMDYRDNLKHRILHRTKWTNLTPPSGTFLLRPVVYFYSGVDTKPEKIYRLASVATKFLSGGNRLS